MPRGPNPEKTKEWTGRLKRLEKSKQTVADFCRSEGVSVPSLYHWKKRLRDVTAPSPFRQVRVASPLVTATHEGTVIQLGNGIHIELGSDLPVAELVVKQVLDAAINASTTGAKPC